jgi:hypothetical protein
MLLPVFFSCQPQPLVPKDITRHRSWSDPDLFVTPRKSGHGGILGPKTAVDKSVYRRKTECLIVLFSGFTGPPKGRDDSDGRCPGTELSIPVF